MHETTLDEQLREAFDAMGPSPEAEVRMLANLQAARTAKPKTPARRAWKVVLPAAACLVLIAGIGALALDIAQQSQLQYGSSSANENASLTEPHDITNAPTDDNSAGSPVGSSDAERPNASEEHASGSSGPDMSASSSEGTPTADGDARYPFITLSTGEQLRITLENDGPLIAPDTAINEEIEQAHASSPAEEGTRACTVYSSRDATHLYVVRFSGDDQLYFADRIAQ